MRRLVLAVRLLRPGFVVDGRQGPPLVELGGRGGGDGEARGHGEAGGGQVQRDVAGGEVLVGLQLGDGGPLGGLGVQHPLDESRRQRVDVLRAETGNRATELDFFF